MKLDKWDKVNDVMKENGINEDDENMKISLSNQANKFFENKDYDKAEEYYKKAGNKKGLINVYFAKEDYEKAGEIIKEPEDGDENLDEIGDKFITLCLLDEAVECYIKNNNIKKAINTCFTLNHWDKPMEIAEKYNYYEINDLFKNFSDDLLKKGKKMDLIDFFLFDETIMRDNNTLEELTIQFHFYNISNLFNLISFNLRYLLLGDLDIESFNCFFKSYSNKEFISNSNLISFKLGLNMILILYLIIEKTLKDFILNSL